METRFIADSNVGKLAKWLRMMGYDTLFSSNIDDDEMVDIGIKEGRVVLTKDTQIIKRRVATSGQLKIILTRHDDPKHQLRQVVKALKLDYCLRQFTRCLECNDILLSRSKEEVKDLVPPYVFLTQTQYMQCPSCLKLYWRGTHWHRMKKELEQIAGEQQSV